MFIKASITAVKRALKPFLLLLICSLCLWFIYSRYQAFESHNSKIYVTTTTHQPIAKSDLDNTTQSKNESHHEIIEEKKLERKGSVQMQIKSKTINLEMSTAQNTTPKIQPNFSSVQSKIEEQKPNRIIQVHDQDHDDTTIKSDIDTDTMVFVHFNFAFARDIRPHLCLILGSKSTNLL